MLQICLGFFMRRNGKFFCKIAPTQALDLGKNKPHPVSQFSAALQFPAYVFEDEPLGIYETLQIVRIVHEGRSDI